MITKQEFIQKLKDLRDVEIWAARNFKREDFANDKSFLAGLEKHRKQAECYDTAMKFAQQLPDSERGECNYKNVVAYIRACSHIHELAQHASEKELASVWSVGREIEYDNYEDMSQLDENIGNIRLSRFLTQLEKEIRLAEREKQKRCDFCAGGLSDKAIAKMDKAIQSIQPQAQLNLCPNCGSRITRSEKRGGA